MSIVDASKALFTHCSEQRVAFYDVDSMDVVWHGNYCKYLEVARCAMLDALGFNYHSMRDHALLFPIVDMRLRYMKPALFDETIFLSTHLIEWEYRMKIGYEIFNAKKELLTEAYTIQAAVDANTRELIIGTPTGLEKAMQKVLSEQG